MPGSHVAELAREREGARWRIEPGNQPVAGALDDRSAVTAGRVPRDAVMVIEEAMPRFVAGGGRDGRRADDVGKCHGLHSPLGTVRGTRPDDELDEPVA
jgi:hypothetical protein